MPVSYKATVIQKKARSLISTVIHALLVGGSRSGKTFEICHILALRALAAPGSRHAMLRFRFNHIKASVILDTFPKMMTLCFPGVPYTIDKTDWYAAMPDGSQIWFGGLDDKERTEKILGQEYATIAFNEASQIPYSSRVMAMTRLAQLVNTRDGVPLTLRTIADENPPSKAHWTYQMYVRKVDPETKKPLVNPDQYGYIYMNPIDNIENLPASYIEMLRNLGARAKLRFLDGKFAETAAGQLWSDELIEKQRHLKVTPDLVRIVVAVDPSGSDDTDNLANDEIGICVAGLGMDGRGYVLEDVTIKAGPATWGNMAVTSYSRHEADLIVGEGNFGGAMVKHVVMTACRAAGMSEVKFKLVNASRGKTVRAEPFSALTEQDKIRFAGYFPELEEELCGFTTAGYIGERSPNRADAMIWALSELFPGMLRKQDKPKQIIREWAPSDPSMAY
jgi:phage terminase large subunit-like protein